MMFATVQRLPTNTENENVIKAGCFSSHSVEDTTFLLLRQGLQTYKKNKLFFLLSQQKLAALKTGFEGNYSEIYPL